MSRVRVVQDASLTHLARSLAADGVTAEVVRAWRAAGVESLLIKGPTVSEWLYPDRVRGYNDSDLVVEPRCVATARSVLVELGFDESPYPDPDTSKHATPWVRAADGAVVDLHHRLWGAWGPTPEQQWELIQAGWTERAEVAGERVVVLRRSGRLWLLAMHASQHRDLEGKPLEDLRRGLRCGRMREWRDASVLADAIGASREMVAGLERLPEGRDLIASLPLLQAQLLPEAQRQRELARLRWSEARAARGAVAVIVDTAQLRRRHLERRYPMARRGGPWLAAAAAMRVGRLARRGPGVALRAVRQR